MKNLRKLLKVLFSKEKKVSTEESLTNVVVRSSAISFLAKAGTIIMGLVTMPIVYNYLDKYQYGVYVTLTSIIAWIDMFDFGIASGLRNRLTEARADKDIMRGKKYITTSYCLLAIVAAVVFFIYVFFIKQINWQIILNAKSIDRQTLDNMAFWVLVCFLLRFVASIIRNVFYAFQKAYLVDVFQFVGKVVYLLAIVVLIQGDLLTLYNVAVFQSAISALVPILAAVFFFTFKERKYAPSLRTIDFSISADILGLGWQFFIIQLSLLILHSGNNVLISQFAGPSSVSGYALSYQLFSYALLAYTIIITPLWSAYTEAWRLENIDWINRTMHKMKQIYCIFVIGSILVVSLSPFIFRIWIGEKADVPVVMSALVALMMLLDMWIRIYDYFINGVGKIRVQMYLNIFMAIFYIPFAYVLSVVFELGANGVVISSILVYAISAILSPLQANMIIKGTAKGIWNK